MDIKVIKNKDVMTTEDMVYIKGGLNESFDSIATTCTCDCIISNSNTSPAIILTEYCCFNMFKNYIHNV